MFKSKKHFNQYQQLAKQPLWRLWKVAFAIFSLWLIIYSTISVWRENCPSQSAGGTLSFIKPQPCNTSDATANTVAAGLAVIVGLALLFWIVRRLTIYIVYGDTKREYSSGKADRTD